MVTVLTSPRWHTETWGTSSMFYTYLAVRVGWAVATITAMVTFTCVFVATISSPVVVTDAESVIVAVCVGRTLGTALISWCMAAVFLLAMTVTLSDVQMAALFLPVLVANTVTVVVEMSIIYALIAIASSWTPATVTFVVAPSLVRATVISTPPIVTYAVVATT